MVEDERLAEGARQPEQSPHAHFAAQQRHLQRLVVSLDATLGSLLAPQQSKLQRQSSTPHRRSSPASKTGKGSAVDGAPATVAASPRSSGATGSADNAPQITPESAVALAAEALAAVKASLALAQHEHGPSPANGEDDSARNRDRNGGGGGRELRVALARAIGALRNACVGAASSTAELLGGEDPTGFAQEVRALANAHEKELEQALVEDQERQLGAPTAAAAAAGGNGGNKVPVASSGPAAAVGLEFWSRQSDLWSGVFTEQ
ncbi:unnamed protein product, partial [Ectocarpus sp. 4 AP-2014]